MKIGDSALDYFSKSQLENNEQGWHNYSHKEYSSSLMPGKGIYKWFLVSYKNDDDNFTIEGLVGGIEKMNYGIDECNSDLSITASDISKKFKNTSQEEKKYYKSGPNAARSYPFTGKSTVTSLSFNFLDGAKIILACYIMDKEVKKKESFLTSISNKKDTFRVDIRSYEFMNFLKKNK
tara:strand:- start:653 stop:1186 length:534 start_codon:yes stop_codon:yes gene_type:complete